MLKLEVAAELRGLAKELEQIQRLEPAATSRWRVGVVLGVPKLAKVARRTCAAWAWIVRQGLTSGNYAGFVLPRKDERENQRFANLPHYRLREFVKWATTLPGAKGLPHDTRGTYGNSGDNWIWAINTVADWLDNLPDKPEPVTKPLTRVTTTGGAGKSSANGKRRGRLPKDDSDAKRASFLAKLRTHPSLKEDPKMLAKETDVSEATARRWLKKEEDAYRNSRVNDLADE